MTCPECGVGQRHTHEKNCKMMLELREFLLAWEALVPGVFGERAWSVFYFYPESLEMYHKLQEARS